MLSQNNIDKLKLNGIYSHKPEKKYRDKLYHDDLYWCCNWCFYPKFINGNWHMIDSYWDDAYTSLHIVLTDENFKEFEFVFNRDEVKQIKDCEVDEYENKDIFRVALDSGGWKWGGTYYVKKDAKKSNDLLINKKEEEIKHLTYKLKYANSELQRLKSLEESQ